jgi:hypothetical protein
MSDNDLPDWLRAVQEANKIVRPYLPPELVQIMNAGLREMLSLSRQQRNVFVHPAVATAVATVPQVSVFVRDGDAVRADDREVSLVSASSTTDVGMPLDAKTVFLAIVWVFAVLLPLKIGLLPSEVQTIIRDYLVTVGTALIIHWRVQDSRKHD